MKRFVWLLAGLAVAGALQAQQSGVSATLHNLSVGGPGELRAEQETEVCKFCHVPHNALAATPLWGHALSRTGSYAVPDVGRGQGRRRPAPQPDGSSRLCLSCHDGTVALGEVGRGRPIPMAGAQRLDRRRRAHLGTDLSGSHPISLVVSDGDVDPADTSVDIGLKPLAQIQAEGTVRLDAQGKMQCTACHDPHADRFYQPGRVPRFWVRPTVDEVCRACHELR